MSRLLSQTPRDSEIVLAHLWNVYQPPDQTDEWVKLITDECYRPLTRWLSKIRLFRATISINASLVRHLIRLRLDEVIENFGIAAQRGVIELTGSGANHPILPELLSYSHGEYEVRRQIELNERLMGDVFSGVWERKGFFPPEMAFSVPLAHILKDMGYKWAITDAALYDASNPGTSIPFSKVGTVDGLPVFFKSSYWSKKFALEWPGHGIYDTSGFVYYMVQELKQWFDGHVGHLALAYDGETWGHHIKPYNIDALDRYVGACIDCKVRTALFSDILNEFDKTDVRISPGTWSTEVDDIRKGNYWPLWRHKHNPVHVLLGQMTQYAIGLVHLAAEKAADHSDSAKVAYEIARKQLDQGVFSCKEWWANPLHGKWNPNHIWNGFKLLQGAIYHATHALELAGIYDLRINGFNGPTSDVPKIIWGLEDRLKEATY